MLYEFNTPAEYEQFINQYTTGDFSTLDMESFIAEVKKLKPGDVYLEVGVKHGKSLLTATLAAREGVELVGVDIADNEERQNVFRQLGLTEYVTFIHGYSHRVARLIKKPISLLFLDGDHSYSGIKLDIDSWLPLVKKGGVILFHDCDETSPGVVDAVNETFPGRVELFKTPVKNTSMAKVVV